MYYKFLGILLTLGVVGVVGVLVADSPGSKKKQNGWVVQGGLIPKFLCPENV